MAHPGTTESVFEAVLKSGLIALGMISVETLSGNFGQAKTR